jgi:hypothetical protein
MDPADSTAVESGEHPLSWCQVVAGMNHGVGDALVHAAQVLLDHRRFTGEMLVKRPFGDR